MTFLVPADAGVLIFLLDWIIFDSIILHHNEKFEVTTMGKRSELIIIPLFIEDVLYLRLWDSSEILVVHSCTRLADVCTKPENAMG